MGRLGLLDDDGGPRVLPITYALAGGALVTAVDHYEDDWSRLAWVQAIGAVSILDAVDAPDALAALAARYAPYRERPPAGPVIALEPDRVLWWRA